MSAQCWKVNLELGRHEEKSKLVDDDRVDTIMEYLLEKAPKSCYDANNKKELKCNCLSLLEDHSLRNSVALWTLWFARLAKETQQMIIIEKIRATKLVAGQRQKNQFLQLYFIPFTTELPDVAEKLGDVRICKCAMMAVLRMGRSAWSTCKEAVDSGSNPQHGLKGQECARSKKFKIQVEPGLKEFYTTVVIPLSGPRPTRSTRQQSGAANAEEDLEDDFTELDPEWTKRRLFGRYCWDLGYSVTKGSTEQGSTEQVKRREDEDWLASGAEYGQVCSWGFFWGYWRQNHSKIIVPKPSKDICGLCYQFHLGDRTKALSSTPSTRNDDSSIQSEDDDDNDGDDEDGILMLERERETQKVANDIKQHIEDATSMRALCRTVIEEAKTATKNDVADEEMVITLVADYCQNMEMPYFGKDQPGETYYYSPKTINVFGIVNCNEEKEVLHSYSYGEEHGGKGGNNVASLLMKYLDDRGLLDGTKRKSLNIVMDNCAGQNKNNYVLRLAPYLVEKGYFQEVHFVFLVVGHTKNVADRLFNILKKLYRHQNIFTTGMMLKAMTHELTIPYAVDWQVFKNWDKFLNRLYKSKMASVKKWQMFSSSTDLGLTKMCYKSSNLQGAETEEEVLRKPRLTDLERNSILMQQPTPLYPTIPGLREIKQVELWSKYRPLVPEEFRNECCPKPAIEVIEREKNKKKAKGKLKRDEKKVKGKQTVKPCPTPKVASTSNGDAQQSAELTSTTTTSDHATSTRTPSSPCKRSHEEAGLVD
jgi:hypothetical protein